MKTTTLGRSGLMVSRIAFGTWQLGGDWGRFDEDAAVAAIRRARELGVNFFDTAHAYGFGASERLLGKALRDELTRNRDQLVLATKGALRMTDSGLVRDASPQWLRQGVDASLTALGIDHIDLYQVHWPDPKVPVTETAGALRELVTEGKIGHVGVSNYDAPQMAEFARTLPVETVQPPYHLFRREIEDEVLPYSLAVVRAGEVRCRGWHDREPVGHRLDAGQPCRARGHRRCPASKPRPGQPCRRGHLPEQHRPRRDRQDHGLRHTRRRPVTGKCVIPGRMTTGILRCYGLVSPGCRQTRWLR